MKKKNKVYSADFTRLFDSIAEDITSELKKIVALPRAESDQK